MNSWADESEDHPDYTHGGSSGGGINNMGTPHTPPTGERPRLHLKPRSSTATATPASPSSTKSNPFGAAKPREEVLASKGIDPTLVDTRIEKKAHVPRLTAEQDRQVELLRKELTEIEEKMREANENELPEEEYRVAAEGKREELNELMRRFQEVNLEAGGGAAAAGAAGGGPSPAGREKEGERGGEGDERRGSTTKFERPSERRRRLEQKRREERSAGGGRGYHGNRDRYHDNKNNYEGGEDPYASFGGSSRNRHHDSTSGRGYGGSGYGDRDSYRGGGGGGGGRGRGGGGARYHDRDNRGSYNGYRNDRYSDDRRDSGRGRGGGVGYNNPQGSNNRPTYDDKYAGDRYNY